MNELLLGIASAFWLGLLTAISPCPLATNIAAVSYVGQRVGSPRSILCAGILYALGRMLTYVVLGALLVSSLLSAPGLSHVLQKYMNIAIGPILILVGMVLVELIEIKTRGMSFGAKFQSRVQASGLIGALLLGIVFALSFCPVSAALFFGSLLPLSLKVQSGILLPASYGIATGVPVLLFTCLLALGSKGVSAAYDKLVVTERRLRLATGMIFIIVGIYLCLNHIFGVSL